VQLSVVLITMNEEANIARTLASVTELADEIIVIDSGSTDRTLEIARTFGPKVKIFEEEWKGFARQKNSAISKANGDWILSLDADEEVSPLLRQEILDSLRKAETKAYSIPRKNFFLGRWIRRGGFYPDRKLRLVRRELAMFEDRAVHEDMKISVEAGSLGGPLLHHAYPTLSSYLEHMNRYSSLGAEMAVAGGQRGFSLFNIVVRPWATFFYNYFLRLGFLDGREGLLLHLYHAVYVSWKYGKIWEISRDAKPH
jgi:glycosyltransferase involved in cell wall biosynthesis